MVVTAFRGLLAGGGMFAPQGVDNFDANASEGYFIGGSTAPSGGLILRRISDPGGTPSISTNIIVTVPQRTDPIKVPHLGNTGGANGQLTGGDERLAMAQIRNGRLWTAHSMSVNNTGGVTGTLTRNAARWYELQNLDTTPTLAQLGTVFSPYGRFSLHKGHYDHQPGRPEPHGCGNLDRPGMADTSRCTTGSRTNPPFLKRSPRMWHRRNISPRTISGFSDLGTSEWHHYQPHAGQLRDFSGRFS